MKIAWKYGEAAARTIFINIVKLAFFRKFKNSKLTNNLKIKSSCLHVDCWVCTMKMLKKIAEFVTITEQESHAFMLPNN